jgi:two-component system, chemotaxis family, chemotaxis protein CheY
MSVRILIVDDLSFMRKAIREIVESSGFVVLGEAENGEQGVSQYQEKRPDIVLMDITMPVLDGIEALRRIVRLDGSARVIMCSALGQQEYIVRAIQIGARDFIVKPFRPERIVSAVSKVMRSAM